MCFFPLNSLDTKLVRIWALEIFLYLIFSFSIWLCQLRHSVGAVAEQIKRFSSQQESPSCYLPRGPVITRSKSSTPQPSTPQQPLPSDTIIEEEVRSCDIMWADTQCLCFTCTINLYNCCILALIHNDFNVCFVSWGAHSSVLMCISTICDELWCQVLTLIC